VRRNLVAVVAAFVIFAAGCAGDSGDGAEAPGETQADGFVDDSSPPSVVESEPPLPSSTAVVGELVDVLGLTGDVAPAHDPDIAHDGDWYYIFLTGPGVAVKRSRDLVHWESTASVFTDPMPAWIDYDWVEPGGGLGAPDVEWFGDRWHLYYHAHEFATNNAVTGHASNVTLDVDDPDYEWIDDGLVMASTSDDTYSVLDANAVVDETGVPWLSFGSFWDGIQLVELDPTTGAPLADASFHRLAARDPWILGVEASSMAFRDGYWYLFVSWGFCCQGVDTQYELRVGRSRDIAGPYLDIADRPMMENGGSLLLGAYDRVRGPGSGDVLVTEGESVLVHHWYDVENDGESTLGVRPLLWAPDGWPVAADTGFETVDPSTADAAALAGTWVLSQYSEGQEATLGLAADGSLDEDLGRWSYDSASGVIEITIEADCPSLQGGTHMFFVGSDLALGFGHSDSPFPLRARRSEEPLPSTCAKAATS
jgi:arabinan endo-1,5-alpha-L-arabinosidase